MYNCFSRKREGWVYVALLPSSLPGAGILHPKSEHEGVVAGRGLVCQTQKIKWPYSLGPLPLSLYSNCCSYLVARLLESMTGRE